MIRAQALAPPRKRARCAWSVGSQGSGHSPQQLRVGTQPATAKGWDTASNSQGSGHSQQQPRVGTQPATAKGWDSMPNSDQTPETQFEFTRGRGDGVGAGRRTRLLRCSSQGRCDWRPSRKAGHPASACACLACCVLGLLVVRGVRPRASLPVA